MGLRIVQVDAFTDRRFGGNPAAVCVLPEPRDAAWMQAVAREMNLSETAFLRPDGDRYRLRWFTPAVEVDLCGHATLASAHVLWEDGHLAADQAAAFHTRSGLLGAVRRGEWIELDFPATPPTAAVAPPGLVEALGAGGAGGPRGARPRYGGKTRFDYLGGGDGGESGRALQPDLTPLGRGEARGVMEP